MSSIPDSRARARARHGTCAWFTSPRHSSYPDATVASTAPLVALTRETLALRPSWHRRAAAPGAQNEPGCAADHWRSWQPHSVALPPMSSYVSLRQSHWRASPDVFVVLVLVLLLFVLVLLVLVLVV